MDSLLDLTVVQLSGKIKAGEVTAAEAVQAALARIGEMEPAVHAYVTIDGERAPPGRNRSSATSGTGP